MDRVRCLAALGFFLFAGARGLSTHEVFRFVGTVTKWDPKTHAVDMLSREQYQDKTGDYPRHLVLRDDCKVIRDDKEISRSELKPGVYVVVDAVGVDINDLEATNIALKPPPPKD